MAKIAVVVEPQPHVARLAEANLANAGWTVRTCSDTQLAMSIIRECRPELIMTGSSVPGLDEFRQQMATDPELWAIPLRLLPS